MNHADSSGRVWAGKLATGEPIILEGTIEERITHDAQELRRRFIAATHEPGRVHRGHRDLFRLRYRWPDRQHPALFPIVYV